MRYHEIINEGRDAPLFHSTNLVAAPDIIRSDSLSDHTGQGINGKVEQGVSLTRNYFHSLKAEVIFVLDQAMMRRDGIKLSPVLCRGSKRYSPYDQDDQRGRECEEFAHGTIQHLHRYIIKIVITPKGRAFQQHLQGRSNFDGASLTPLLDHPKLA